MSSIPVDAPPAYSERRSHRASTSTGASLHADGVSCDGCHQPIKVGIRYKCQNCQNYDLCSDCCDVPPRDHPSWHSFLRIGLSSQVPVHEGYSCDGCGQEPIRGKRFICKTCKDFDLCECCKISQPSYHPMWHRFICIASPALNTYHHQQVCNGCNMSPIRGPRYRCQDIRCHPDGVGFDLCSDCMEDGTKHPGDHLMLRITGHSGMAAVPVAPLVPVVCNSSTAPARPTSVVPSPSAVATPARPPAVVTARPATSPGRSRRPAHHTPPAPAPVRSSASSRPTTAPVRVINAPAPSATASSRRSRLLSVLSS
ncbi:hypothetical protein EDD18DRAFT_1143248 [Armillaria luteobubalina]|uniref:ZZ-type domain-containing protein n=1 Tax=Armillaria luteobubalina TaxID=153913 RepID=A0AA39QEQ6_9AGAR|nr:hypothetical protein EDD18DRAFT_1143248 [Armillaria luteobubalina]